MLFLLHGQIPYKPGVTAMLRQGSRLLRAGKQPKPAHINNLSSNTDNLPKGGGGISSPAEAEGFRRKSDEIAVSPLRNYSGPTAGAVVQ
jgi:hypothetical protein